MSEKTLAGCNMDKPIVEVKWSELELVQSGQYKSECPVCKKGMLLIGRDKETFELQELDMCILCGQKFRYLDIEDLRKGKEINE